MRFIVLKIFLLIVCWLIVCLFIGWLVCKMWNLDGGLLMVEWDGWYGVFSEVCYRDYVVVDDMLDISFSCSVNDDFV